MRTLLALVALLALVGGANAAAGCHPNATLTTPTGESFLVETEPCDGCFFSVWISETSADCPDCIVEVWVREGGPCSARA